MQETDSERSEEAGREEDAGSSPTQYKRGPDRRLEGVRLFAYEGPERRSGRDRRDSQGR